MRLLLTYRDDRLAWQRLASSINRHVCNIANTLWQVEKRVLREARRILQAEHRVQQQPWLAPTTRLKALRQEVAIPLFEPLLLAHAIRRPTLASLIEVDRRRAVLGLCAYRRLERGFFGQST